MYKYCSIFIVGALISFSSAALEPPESAQPPSQQQLSKLLSGNTLDGEWAERPFRQYFSAAGSTRYKEGSGPESIGRWRIDLSGRYCSIWPPSSHEACYEVLVEGNNIYWKAGKDFYPSQVSEGFSF